MTNFVIGTRGAEEVPREDTGMPLAKQLTCVLAAIVASVAGMVTGITQNLPSFSGFAAGLFAITLVATAFEANLPFWHGENGTLQPAAAAEAALRNTRLVALGYLWGALALFLAYRMTPLRWQHGLQYGAGMALIAWLIQLYAHFLAQPNSRLRTPRALNQVGWLAALHGAGAVGGLLFLVLTGKINSLKDDWAANQVFLAGGLAIVALSVISVYTHIRLSRPTSLEDRSVAGAGRS